MSSKIRTVSYVLYGTFFLTSCQHVTMQSRESIDAVENKPWRLEEDSVGAMVDQPGKTITPHIRFSIPIEEEQSEVAKARRQKEQKRSLKKTDLKPEHMKIARDPQHHTIKIVSVESNCGK